MKLNLIIFGVTTVVWWAFYQLGKAQHGEPSHFDFLLRRKKKKKK